MKSFISIFSSIIQDSKIRFLYIVFHAKFNPVQFVIINKNIFRNKHLRAVLQCFSKYKKYIFKFDTKRKGRNRNLRNTVVLTSQLISINYTSWLFANRHFPVYTHDTVHDFLKTSQVFLWVETQARSNYKKFEDHSRINKE